MSSAIVRDASTSDSRVINAIIPLTALLGFLLSVAALYPGQYPFDSAYQYWQARTGEFSNITPVPMPWVWSLLLNLTGNVASLHLVNLALFWIGLGLCFQAIRAAIGVRVVAILICGMNPLVLAQMAHVLTDAHLAALLTFAAGLIAHGGTRGRPASLWGAILIFIYAGCIRHNALLAILPLSALAAGLLSRTKRSVSVHAWVGAAIVGCLSLILGTALDRSITLERRGLGPMLQLWDLAAISVATDQLYLPEFTHGPGLSVEELRETGAFDPTSNTALFSRSRSGVGSGLNTPYPAERERAITRRWLSTIAERPAEYIAHRARTIRLMTGRHAEEPYGAAYYVARHQYRDNPPLPKALAPQWQSSIYAIVHRLHPSWLFSALPYLAVHTLCLALGWRWRYRFDAALATSLSASALLYSASFLILAPSAEMRYLTWPIISSALALSLILSAWRPSSRAAAQPSPA